MPCRSIEEDMIAQYSGLADSSALSAFAAAGKISLSESGAQALLAGQRAYFDSLTH